MSMAIAAWRPAVAANPIVPGWYADPEIRIFAHRYWIYPTASDPSTMSIGPFNAQQTAIRRRKQVWPIYLRQTFIDAFSSPDLVHWTAHRRVLDVKNVAWAADALWAPSVIEAGGRYHIFFGANDIQNDRQTGGIGLAASDSPAGPFRDELGHPLIGAFHNGAQPIDPFAFRDDDGSVYLYYGGWGRCNVVRLSADLRHIEAIAPRVTYKEVTPNGYVEGVFVIKRRGVYYLMWSEGDWTTPQYRVAYAMGRSPTGPFTPAGVILQQDPRVARGAGHHSVVNIPGTDDWYIVYHRRPLGDADGNHRELAIDRMRFNADGTIAPVHITAEGVAPRPLAGAVAP
ncbi:MAG: family 43 glycosylhydrolase [Caulobacteraceae bacterium]|nr:family 43 glycosylhydrolase [Caulobacter sp.]